MAKLPSRESLGGLPAVQSGGISRVSVPSFAGAGSGISDLGSGLKQAAGAINAYARASEDHANQSVEFESERRFQEFDWEQRKSLDESMRNIQPGQATTFATGWQENYTKAAKDFLATVPENLKPKYDQRLFGSERDMFGAATTFARTEQKRFSTNSIGEAVETVYRPRARVSTTDELGNVTTDFDRLVSANPDLTPIEKDELARKGRRAIALSHLDTLNPDQVRTLNTARTQPGDTTAAGLLRRFEGFRDGAYWDVNAHRAGFGSDTVTRADGKIEKVTPNTRVSREDAERDLARRIPEFQATIQKQVGADRWAGMPPNVQAALTSVAYNYGSLPKSVVSAVQSGDTQAIAQSVRSLSANRGRRAQEADVILGAGGQPLAALNDEDWQRAESAAMTRQSRQAVQVAETFERHIIDAAAGRGTLPDRASIELDPTMDEPRRNALLRQHDAAAKAVVGTQQFMDRLNSGGTFNPFDTKEREYADAAFVRMGADTTALQLIAHKTGIIPKSAATQMQAGVASNDPARFTAAVTMAGNLMVQNPQIFAGVTGGNDIEKAAVRYNHFVDRLGMEPEKAARKIMEMETPEYKSKQRAHLKSEDIDKRLRDETVKGTLLSDMMSAFGETKVFGFNLPGTRPTIETNPRARDAALHDYADLVKESYLEHGDLALAKSEAAKQMKRVWGVSRVNGSGVFMRYPPDRAPAFHGVPDAPLRIAQQASESIKAETGQDVPRDRIQFIPLGNGQTARPYLNGETPPYLLSWTDKNGIVQNLNPGRAFVVDVPAMRGALSEDRRKAMGAMQTEVERREGLSTLRRQQRRATNVLDEPVPSGALPAAAAPEPAFALGGVIEGEQ